MVAKTATRVNIWVLISGLWQNFGRTQEVFLHISANNDVAHITVHLQPNDRFSNCVCFVLII